MPLNCRTRPSSPQVVDRIALESRVRLPSIHRNYDRRQEVQYVREREEKNCIACDRFLSKHSTITPSGRQFHKGYNYSNIYLVVTVGNKK